MKIEPYLNFNGQCREAFEFYASCLGGKITAMIPFAESGSADFVPPDAKNQIMHACLEVGGEVIMGSDAPGMYTAPAGNYVSVHVDETADADRIFGALAESGQVQMPIDRTEWAERFGMVVDRFGTPWMVNCPGDVAQNGGGNL